MRLGGHFHADTLEELEPLCADLDAHGLSAIRAPGQLAQRSDDDCVAFGEKARQLGLNIGEAGFWQNLIDPDQEAVDQRIQTVRTLLRKADLMRARDASIPGQRSGATEECVLGKQIRLPAPVELSHDGHRRPLRPGEKARAVVEQTRHRFAPE